MPGHMPGFAAAVANRGVSTFPEGLHGPLIHRLRHLIPCHSCVATLTGENGRGSQSPIRSAGLVRTIPSRYDLMLTTIRLRCLAAPGTARTNVTFDRALRDNVPSLFRQSLEDIERRSSLVIGSIRVRHAVTNTSSDHRQPGPTTPRSTKASTRSIARSVPEPEVLSQAFTFVYSADANSVSHARAAFSSSPAAGPMAAAMAASSSAPETEKC